MQTHLRLNSRLLPALVGLLLLLELAAPYDGWTVLLVGLGGAWLAAYFWARALARGLQIRREIRFGWAQVGDRLEERFTLTNHSLLPALWVEVDDYTDMPGYQVSRATGAGGLSENQWRTEGLCTQRGLFTHGPTGLRASDPLGIYTVELFDPHATSLLVTPPIVPLPSIEVAAGGRAGEGRPRPDAPERTVSTSGVRPYLPGDSLRWIHWRTSARRDNLYVRLFEGTPEGDWWIILDLNRAVQAGSGQDTTEEHGVVLAASLMDRGLRLSQAVGMVINGQGMAWLAPQKGEAQRWQALRALALARPGERPLDELLARMRRSFGRHASLILITPDASGGWVTELLHLLWTGAAPTVLLLDQASFYAEPPSADGGLKALLATLSELGVRNYRISRELLNRPEARPGQRGRREWRITPRGRAIRVDTTPEESWKVLP